MPKLTGPLFSFEATKTLGKALTYQRRPGGASVYGYKPPRVPLTPLQIQQRGLIASATAYWQSLSDGDKGLWDAKALGRGISGYAYMIKQYCQLNLDRPLWLPFNEGTGVTTADKSGHGNTGTIEGATWVQLANGLWTLSFDGNDYVDCGASTLFDITEAITLEAWAYPTSVVSAGNIFVSKLSATPTDGSYSLHKETSVFKFLIVDTALRVVTGGTPTPNYWYFLVGTYDRQYLRLYVNGYEVDSLANTGAIKVSTQKVYVGTFGTPPTYGLVGKMPFVGIFSRAKGAAEILDQFKRERKLFGL